MNSYGSADEVLIFSDVYLRWGSGYDTMISEPTESKISETISYEQRGIEIGSMIFVVKNLVIRPCFAMKIWGRQGLHLVRNHILHEGKSCF